jgi:hypothetical protein
MDGFCEGGGGMKRTKPFATEAELCARFIAAVGADWTPYAETAGWDILLVRKADGFQVGIEAKLRINAHVISQALEEYGAFAADRSGPDCRAILVPEEDAGGFDLICTYLGITIIRVLEKQRDHCGGGVVYRSAAFSPALPKPPDHAGDNYRHWHEWAPARRHELPDYVPDVAAGSPSPIQLTHWKICAIKIAVILEKRGFLVRGDFKHVNIDHRRWLPSGAGWLRLDAGRYLRAPYFPDFKAQHPRVYDEIAADYDSWKPVVHQPAVQQKELL